MYNSLGKQLRELCRDDVNVKEITRQSGQRFSALFPVSHANSSAGTWDRKKNGKDIPCSAPWSTDGN